MDMVGDAIASVRIGRAEACWVSESGAWGFRYPALPVSGFHILVRGAAWLITEDAPARALAPGDVVFSAAGAPHGLSHAPAGALAELPPAVLGHGVPREAETVFLCGAYWLPPGPAHPYLRTLPPVIAISPDYARNRRLRALADLLESEVSEAAPGGAVTRPALLDLLLTQVLREWLDGRPAVADPAVAIALGHIRDNPAAPWTVRQLSDRAGLPPREFTRRFTEVAGLPPRAYLTRARLAQGARLLRESDAPLSAIARRVGYSTEFAFGGAFRREYGISPGRFRKSGRCDVDDPVADDRDDTCKTQG